MPIGSLNLFSDSPAKVGLLFRGSAVVPTILFFRPAPQNNLAAADELAMNLGSPRRSHRGLIAARYGNGGVGLPSLSSSSSCSLLELLATSPVAPTLSSHLYSPECLEWVDSANFAGTEF